MKNFVYSLLNGDEKMQNQAELRNCPTCGTFFNYTGIKDVCGKCAQEEERMYEKVYRFLRRRENRTATVEAIVEATGASETLLHKWVRRGRLQPSLFPNLGYPCESCGAMTQKGKLCVACTETLEKEINQHEAVEEFREAMKESERRTYHSDRDSSRLK